MHVCGMFLQGRVVLSLVCGHVLTEKDDEIPEGLPQDLLDFLQRLASV